MYEAPPLPALQSNAFLLSGSIYIDDDNDSVFDDGNIVNDHSDDGRSDLDAAAMKAPPTRPGVRQEEREIRALAQKETRRVVLFKVLVLLSILLAAGIVSAGTYVFLDSQDDSDFDDNVRWKKIYVVPLSFFERSIHKFLALIFSLSLLIFPHLLCFCVAFLSMSNLSTQFVMPLNII
jgi:hypothetical protein